MWVRLPFCKWSRGVYGGGKKKNNNRNWSGPEHRGFWLAPKGLCSVKDGVCRCPTHTCCQQPRIYSWNYCSRYGQKCTVNIIVYIIEFISHVKLLRRGKDPFALPNIIMGCLLAHFVRLKSGRSLEGTTTWCCIFKTLKINMWCNMSSLASLSNGWNKFRKRDVWKCLMLTVLLFYNVLLN